VVYIIDAVAIQYEFISKLEFRKGVRKITRQWVMKYRIFFNICHSRNIRILPYTFRKLNDLD
ncbi:MAG TPA: hypothetical protein VE574_00615, partial [Nitrososphaeraceae archaeon]|nr:hypothetical protein [Nitrososphaeraceae archaeon]